ncbi:MAG: hypothetical protein ABSA59_12575 [Terriglobia bacterium]|jgi:lysylphosphatidylglycerol synthetase-like protein (DUF2156 family)
MALIVAINLIVVACLVVLTLTKGFECTLTFFALLVILIPSRSNILLGIFDITIQRSVA